MTIISIHLTTQILKTVLLWWSHLVLQLLHSSLQPLYFTAVLRYLNTHTPVKNTASPLLPEMSKQREPPVWDSSEALRRGSAAVGASTAPAPPVRQQHASKQDFQFLLRVYKTAVRSFHPLIINIRLFGLFMILFPGWNQVETNSPPPMTGNWSGQPRKPSHSTLLLVRKHSDSRVHSWTGSLQLSAWRDEVKYVWKSRGKLHQP